MAHDRQMSERMPPVFFTDGEREEVGEIDPVTGDAGRGRGEMLIGTIVKRRGKKNAR